MKKFLFLAILGLVSTVSVMAQQDIKFAEASFKFGKIEQNKPVTHIFTYTNNGAKPAVIEFASAECGCTTPEYSKEAILKGKSSTIKVTYNAAAMGAFSKRVTVKFAGINDPVILTIEGEVVAGKPKPGAK
jgi:hypothetical protein